MAAWEDKVKARVRSGLNRYVRIFDEARRSKRKEADVGNMVYVMLEDVFGYDKINDITAEYRVRGQYADYAVRLGPKLKFFVEVKGPTINLNAAHLLQVTTYAVKEGVEWVILTNGLAWNLYHIRKVMPIAEDLVFSCNLADPARAETVRMLFVLTKEAMQRDLAKEYLSQKLAVSAPNLLRVLYSEAVVEKMRRELRALTGYRASTAELRTLLETEVVRPDFAGHAKKSARRSSKQRERAQKAEQELEPPQAPSPEAAPTAVGPSGNVVRPTGPNSVPPTTPSEQL